MERFKGIDQTPTIELIGDLRHAAAVTLMAALAARDHKDIAFITDAISEPIPYKKFKYGPGLEVAEDGACCFLSGTNTICGSCTNLHKTL